MAPESVCSFEKMLTSFAYDPIASPATTVVADDSAAGGTRKNKQKKTKEAPKPKGEKTGPAPPQTPPRPPRRRAGPPPLPWPDGAAAGDATSAATTPRETTAADFAFAITSATVEGARVRLSQQRRELAVPPGPAGPGTPLVLPPDTGKHKRNQIDAAADKRNKRRKRSSGDGDKKKKKKVVVVSPYFAAASSDQRALEGGGGGVEGEVEVVVQRRAKKKKRAREGAESAAKPRASSSGGRSPLMAADDGKKNMKRKREHPSVQLSAAQRMADAYKRVPDDNPWVPPFSEHELLQELHFFDHWRVLVICMLLNRTTGREVQKVLPRLFLLCRDAETTTKVSEEEIEEIIRHLGLQKKRSRMIKQMSEEYLRPEWTHVTQLYGIGKYAADAYAIFCSGMWKEVKPNDHKLVDYWRFLLNDKDARESIVVHKST